MRELPEPGPDEIFHVEDDRPPNWWMLDEVDERRSRLGLDDPKTLAEKIGLTVATVLVAALVMSLLFILVANVQEKAPQAVRIAGKILFETTFAFFLMVVVYIWWKAPWFKDVYLAVERKFLLLCTLLIGAVLAAPVAAVAVAALK